MDPNEPTTTSEPSTETAEPASEQVPPDADGGEAASVEGSPAVPPPPADTARSRVLAAVARREEKALAERRALAAERAELARERQAASAEVDRARRFARLFDRDSDPDEVFAALGVDPKEALFALNDKVLKKGTPDAMHDSAMARVERLQSEFQAYQQRVEAEREHNRVGAISQQFTQFVASDERFPMLAAYQEKRSQETSETFWHLAKVYHQKTGKNATFEQLAEAIEYTLKEDFEHLSKRRDKAVVPPRDDRAKPRTLTNAQATEKASSPRKMTPEEDRDFWVSELRKAAQNSRR